MAKKATKITKREGPTREAVDEVTASLDVLVRQGQERARAEALAALRGKASYCRLRLMAMAGAATEAAFSASDPSMREMALDTAKLFEDTVQCLRDFETLGQR